MEYGFVKEMDEDFDTAEKRVREVLAAEGFGILSEIDVQQAFRNKLDVDHRRYTILGACNPQLARQAVAAEPHIGLLLPCNVLVQENPEGKGTVVSIADPRAMFRIVNNPAAQPVADEAEQRLRRALDQL
jgi:uncharacterized protein (DUF302 family)